MEFINMTPHVINIIKYDGEVMEIPPSGEVARIEVRRHQVGTINGIEIFETEYWDYRNYPPPYGHNKGYIVSRMFIEAMKEKAWCTDHLYAPGELVRNEEGIVIGCEGLSK